MGSDLASVTAVVMAGGKGTRLEPLTVMRPKPLMPVAGRPIMEHILDLLRRWGITNVVAAIHHLGGDIQSHFSDGMDFGVSLRYSSEPKPLGTAGGVKFAEELLGRGTILVISGDSLTDCSLADALAFHREKKSMATVVLSRVANPREFGVVSTDADGRILRFQEKPEWREVFTDTVNTGIYILEPEVLDLIEPGVEADWAGNVFPAMMAKKLPMYGWVMNGYWCDVGSFDQYQSAQDDFLKGKINLPFSDDHPEMPSGGILIGANSTVEEGAVLVPPVLIRSGCRIKKGARIGPGTVIGDNSLVETDAVVVGSTLWDNVYVGHNASLEGAIVCSRATIKVDASLEPETVIGDSATIEAGCTVRERVRIYPHKVIERGTVVNSSVTQATNGFASLFRDLGAAGLSNIEITPEIACRIGASFGTAFPAGSKVITSRDSTKSSRMIKRAVISAIVSTGCEVLDLRAAPLPIARHFVKSSQATGAINVRKLPTNSRVTLIELMDSAGGYVSNRLVRKVQNSFFRESYRRVDSDEIGKIEFASRAVEAYQTDFFRIFGSSPAVSHPTRVVCDYGFTALGATFPSMLHQLGVESMSINAYDDGRMAPRTPDGIRAHLENLASVVRTTDYEMGALFTSDGERLGLVDGKGGILSGSDLMALMCLLTVQVHPGARLAASAATSHLLERMLTEKGGHVERTGADARSQMERASRGDIEMAYDDHGGFIFPEFQNGFDAAFSLAKLLQMLRQTGQTLEEAVAQLPKFQVASLTAHVSWMNKGTLMRILAENTHGCHKMDMIDGVKFFDDDGWTLVLPDSIEPVVHIYAEGEDEEASHRLVDQCATRIADIDDASR